MTRKAVLYSNILKSGFENINIFKEISSSFGYEIIKARNIEVAHRLILEDKAGVFFCDQDLIESFFNKIGDVENAGEPITIAIIKDVPPELDILQKVDNFILANLPLPTFYLSVFTVFKYIIMKEKLKSLRRVTDPEFIKKLLSDTAHAINNILTGMQGYAELAQLNQDDSKLIQDSFQVVIDSSYRVKNEIKNLRAFARVETPIFETINLNDIVEESINLVKTNLEAKEIILATALEDIQLKGDYDQLVQVFLNLLKDAANSVKPGGELNISAKKKNGKIWVEIETTGWKVSNSDYRNLKRIFALNEAILKADSKNGKIENRNVLSICNRIAHVHGGSITLLRGEDEKLIYRVELPLPEKGKKPVPSREELESALSGVEKKRKPAFETLGTLDLDILVVDDEEYVRNTIYYYFHKKGCRVTLAEDGEYGLRMATEKPFDLIFMDYLMPKMGGIEAARKILAKNSEVKIVFITGRDPVDKNKLYKAGVSACINKPFEMRDLYFIAKKVAMEKGLIE